MVQAGAPETFSGIIYVDVWSLSMREATWVVIGISIFSF